MAAAEWKDRCRIVFKPGLLAIAGPTSRNNRDFLAQRFNHEGARNDMVARLRRAGLCAISAGFSFVKFAHREVTFNEGLLQEAEPKTAMKKAAEYLPEESSRGLSARPTARHLL